MRLFGLFIAAASLGGCASHLQIYADEKGETPIAGIPVRTSELFVMTGTYTKLAKGGPCDPTGFQELVSLPVGRLYYVNVDTADFAKTDFTVKFAENGSVSEITMNSEPSSGEALKGVAELVTALGPIAGVGVVESRGGQPCDAGPDLSSIKYISFADWQGGKR